MENFSIFNEYFNQNNFSDRFLKDQDKAVDVIIPVINTNFLFKANLHSFYREIPINKLIIGDGGSNDDTIEIVTKFPRVEIIKQEGYNSQGFAIKELILAAKTKYFIYLHADVFLPPSWFDDMYQHREKYEWYECFRRMTVLFEYPEIHAFNAERAYSGSQFGKTEFMKRIVRDTIDDDYLQRNEDIILMELTKSNGGNYGKIKDTFHYHQTANKKGNQEPNLDKLFLTRKSDPDWEKKIFNMQYRGIIKYLDPKDYLVDNIFLAILKLTNMNQFNWVEFRKWVKETNPIWLDYITRLKFYRFQFRKFKSSFLKILITETQIGRYYHKIKNKS